MSLSPPPTSAPKTGLVNLPDELGVQIAKLLMADIRGIQIVTVQSAQHDQQSHAETTTSQTPKQSHKFFSKHVGDNAPWLVRPKMLAVNWTGGKPDLDEYETELLDAVRPRDDTGLEQSNVHQIWSFAAVSKQTARWVYAAVVDTNPGFLTHVYGSALPCLPSLPGHIGSKFRSICLFTVRHDELDYSDIVRRCPQLRLVVLAPHYIECGKREDEVTEYDPVAFFSGLHLNDEKAMSMLKATVSPHMKIHLGKSPNDDALVMRQITLMRRNAAAVPSYLSLVVVKSFAEQHGGVEDCHIIHAKIAGYMTRSDLARNVLSTSALCKLYRNFVELRPHKWLERASFDFLKGERSGTPISAITSAWQEYVSSPRFPEEVPTKWIDPAERDEFTLIPDPRLSW